MSDRPSKRLRGLRSELYELQDRLDGLGWLFLTLDCPDAAGQAAKAGDAIEALRLAVESDADRLEGREDRRDRNVALAAAGGVSADAIAERDGSGSP